MIPDMQFRVLYRADEVPFVVLHTAQSRAIEVAARQWRWPALDECEVWVMADQPLLGGYRVALVAAVVDTWDQWDDGIRETEELIAGAGREGNV